MQGQRFVFQTDGAGQGHIPGQGQVVHRLKIVALQLGVQGQVLPQSVGQRFQRGLIAEQIQHHLLYLGLNGLGGHLIADLHGGGAVLQLVQHRLLTVALNPQINAGGIGVDHLVQSIAGLQARQRLDGRSRQIRHAGLRKQRFRRLVQLGLVFRVPGGKAVPVRADDIRL